MPLPPPAPAAPGIGSLSDKRKHHIVRLCHHSEHSYTSLPPQKSAFTTHSRIPVGYMPSAVVDISRVAENSA